jgi:hypothetical protein
MMMNRLIPNLARFTAKLAVLLIGAGWLFGCSGGDSGKGGAVSTANQAPTALITAPAGSYFNEGENIAFSGSGSDMEDGQLDSERWNGDPASTASLAPARPWSPVPCLPTITKSPYQRQIRMAAPTPPVPE